MSKLKAGVYRVQYSDKTESINYWDGEHWRFFGMTSKVSDDEMGYSFLWPIDIKLET
mgnify:CR=1 FL=1